ncbi:hypothetical protein MGYG_00009 [Nannizzia gypsea CBS 118893]|uniref:DUF7102 domain-containing protein n=1 Tax=Arthroderma gypseum (strain ATCC MYA-4604 / CBS 118893) TaxID=535722 RepID=E5R1X2_ARTGP|nr:hypothetical protein MGYG_00009 [Nannizzia gypsea CBS 118893]EFQ96965.1 hypothetical protein MGYG_00009 [Nannizzia gypsea CBS 118893]
MTYSDSGEPLLLEYARSHGIALEQQAFDPKMALDGLDTLDSQILDYHVLNGLADDGHRVVKFTKAVGSEKFSPARASCELLSSILGLHKEYMNAKPMPLSHQLLPDWYMAEQVKISSPILSQEASPWLGSAPAAASLLDPSGMQVPLEKLNDEFDEGLAFPNHYTDLRDEILEATMGEKIVCHSATSSIIQQILSHGELRKLGYQKPAYHHQLNEELGSFELRPRTVDKEGFKVTNNSSPAKIPDNTHLQLFQAETLRPLLPDSFSASDSVSSFMEALGKEKPLNNSKNSSTMPQSSTHCHNKTKADDGLQTVGLPVPPDKNSHIILLDKLPPPSDTQWPIVLFLSIDLLTTHGSLIHKLETLTNPPTLLFQELPTYNTYVDKGLSLRDADIILSPKVGMLLVTTMDFMQLHLPGHAIQLKSGIKLNSPFQERIYRICERFDELYIFTLHSAGPTATRPPVSVKQSTYDAMASIRAFCCSLNMYSTMRVLDVSSDVTILAHWIVSLGKKHQSLMLEGSIEVIFGRPCSLPPERHIPDFKPLSNTIDEQFLTQCLELNGFAAAFVLHMLSPILAQEQGTDQGLLVMVTFPREKSAPFPVREALLAGLRELFDGKSKGKPNLKSLLGERGFSRVRDRMRCIVLQQFVPNPQATTRYNNIQV